MAEPGSESNRQLRIRKYPNRRYYDTTRSRHLTLEEIHRCACDGYEIQVTDSKSGTDITTKVLAQIIIDLDPAKLDIFPPALLQRVLCANDQLVQDFTHKYFNSALTAFLESERKFEHTIRQSLGLDSTAAAPVDDGKGRANDATVTQLRQQVKDLERKLSEATQPSKSKRDRG